MPITKSAKKALRQSKTRRIGNLAKKKAYKAAIKELKKTKDVKLLAKTYKAIDKAAKTGVIKKNKAARLKSSASRILNQKTS
ncbi:MAG: hypothetical protein A3G02_01005 [Candidatus Yanofskybacteria bacterium RIFCSPLOWO2_12_FULL_44_13b]|uniref:Small ribosomal subunit protein bS20 n=1 Tax=Candidatus Yanofskybacteria bacterium RIFCSPLOWO2_02_FULL_44_18 TaxID=1802705 RepID=A0A1F8H014_9BACT|nr:MAG: hypothetical protein A2657_02700 [Candidatus Yanofskybacteria bacterium RIFCSPHIGHO2_01_FULL_44_110b]OGN14149.1 MAG: hypothetical protein A3C01_00950 [Candidatus Yanofskybacteria bacterium RIFCSPHIGHO2_02_FULL_44_36b]OGN19247.1 MAG: hypothetical protein A3F50_03050 [Candidatus Yanofskybacteria bacterium RIFCSPHIGHO2_12_FULL_44_29b]OGN25809.1 MAG: hypothetical protein A3B12_02480 [Candidatus Yanofskybacteria bacterium RIFCSPLOWO2_01_FULL_44_88]OGN31015.1 MAG: hypothetical protein A3I96_0